MQSENPRSFRSGVIPVTSKRTVRRSSQATLKLPRRRSVSLLFSFHLIVQHRQTLNVLVSHRRVEGDFIERALDSTNIALSQIITSAPNLQLAPFLPEDAEPVQVPMVVREAHEHDFLRVLNAIPRRRDMGVV
jgi:hypothetical protein